LIATKGNDARGLKRWIVCATSSLPVPTRRDEHGRAGWRRLLDHVIDLPHLGTVAGHRAEGPVFAQLTTQGFHLAKRLLPLDDLVEEHLQPLNVDRLVR